MTAMQNGLNTQVLGINGPFKVNVKKGLMCSRAMLSKSRDMLDHFIYY